jgi:pimeloyl-ACP methyl ester carboxylesterase
VSTPAESTPPQAGSDLLLVHGGWHGGWVWERLAPLLAAQGHRVQAPTLAGLGARAGEFTADIGLRTHVDEILRIVRGPGPARWVLVGHSYGGSVITAVADRAPERVGMLVYLDAPIPADGVPDWEGFPSERRQAMLAGARTLDGLRVPPPDPSIWGLEPGTAAHRELRERLTPHPIRTMTDVPRLAGHWRRVERKCHLLAAGPPPSRFRALHDSLSAEPGWRTSTVPGGHEMMWTHPRELAAALLACLSPAD